MQVLLPDFALFPQKQIETPFKHAKKLIYNQRSRTVEGRRSSLSNTSRLQHRQISQMTFRKQNLSTLLPFSQRLQIKRKQHSFSSNQFATVNFQPTMQQQPIHSRRTNRFMRGNPQKIKSVNKMSGTKEIKSVTPTQFNFLVTHKLQSKRKNLYSPSYESEIIKRSIQAKSRFPTKKARSSFAIIQQYRPWSPNKGQQIFDYQIAS